MDTIEELADPGVSIVRACDVLGVSRATLYRQTQPPRPVLATFVVRASKTASCRSPIVVMQAAEDGHDDRAGGLRRSGDRLLLVESLMRARLVVEVDELANETREMVVAEDQHVIEELPAECALEHRRELPAELDADSRK